MTPPRFTPGGGSPPEFLEQLAHGDEDLLDLQAGRRPLARKLHDGAAPGVLDPGDLRLEMDLLEEPGQPPGEGIVPSTRKTWASGTGFAIAKMIGLGAIAFTISGLSAPAAERPRNTSAPCIASISVRSSVSMRSQSPASSSGAIGVLSTNPGS